MPLLIEDTWLPATLTAPPMTDDEFVAFCNEHPDLSFETTSSGELIVMPLTFTKTGFRNQAIGAPLYIWPKPTPAAVRRTPPQATCFRTAPVAR